MEHEVRPKVWGLVPTNGTRAHTVVAITKPWGFVPNNLSDDEIKRMIEWPCGHNSSALDNITLQCARSD